MKVILNIKPFAIAVATGVVAFMTANETIDNFINFASEDHAMAFFGLNAMTSLICLAGSFEILKQTK